jgi:hypothetical protein
MNTNRYEKSRTHRKLFYLGISPAFWSGTVLAFAVILAALYCLLTHRVSV